MPAYTWYATPVDSSGTSTAASYVVTVFVGTTNPGGYDIFILDANGDGLVNNSEWQSYTGGGGGLNGGSSFRLFDGSPGGAGIIYSSSSYPVGTTGLKTGLEHSFTIDPSLLDPASPVCFVSGTRIATPRGPVPVETLAPGDQVLLASGESAAVVWASASICHRAQLLLNPGYRPVYIPRGTFSAHPGHGRLAVSPQHRIALKSPAFLALVGCSEILIPAKLLRGFGHIRRGGAGKSVSYHHILLQDHALLMAEGIAAESMYLGQETWKSLSKDAHEAIVARLPQWRHRPPPPALPMFDGQIAKALVRLYFKENPPALATSSHRAPRCRCRLCTDLRQLPAARRFAPRRTVTGQATRQPTERATERATIRANLSYAPLEGPAAGL